MESGPRPRLRPQHLSDARSVELPPRRVLFPLVHADRRSLWPTGLNRGSHSEIVCCARSLTAGSVSRQRHFPAWYRLDAAVRDWPLSRARLSKICLIHGRRGDYTDVSQSKSVRPPPPSSRRKASIGDTEQRLTMESDAPTVIDVGVAPDSLMPVRLTDLVEDIPRHEIPPPPPPAPRPVAEPARRRPLTMTAGALLAGGALLLVTQMVLSSRHDHVRAASPVVAPQRVNASSAITTQPVVVRRDAPLPVAVAPSEPPVESQHASPAIASKPVTAGSTAAVATSKPTQATVQQRTPTRRKRAPKPPPGPYHPPTAVFPE